MERLKTTVRSSCSRVVSSPRAFRREQANSRMPAASGRAASIPHAISFIYWKTESKKTAPFGGLKTGGIIMPYHLLEIPYDRNAAAEYAGYWAYRRNPRYDPFDEIGGDCTNFVSQCLFAGCGVRGRGLNIFTGF